MSLYGNTSSIHRWGMIMNISSPESIILYTSFCVMPIGAAIWITNVSDKNGLVQDCSNSSALAMELLQYYTKPSIWCNQFMPEQKLLLYESYSYFHKSYHVIFISPRLTDFTLWIQQLFPGSLPCYFYLTQVDRFYSMNPTVIARKHTMLFLSHPGWQILLYESYSYFQEAYNVIFYLTQVDRLASYCPTTDPDSLMEWTARMGQWVIQCNNMNKTWKYQNKQTAAMLKIVFLLIILEIKDMHIICFEYFVSGNSLL